MNIIKYIHITCAILTVISFTVRGVWMLQGSPTLYKRASRIAPHIIDAVLLVSGIIMLLKYYKDFYHFDWLLLKLAAVVVYIISGGIALKYGKTLGIRCIALFVSWILLSAIITLAITRPVSLF